MLDEELTGVSGEADDIYGNSYKNSNEREAKTIASENQAIVLANNESETLTYNICDTARIEYYLLAVVVSFIPSCLSFYLHYF